MTLAVFAWVVGVPALVCGLVGIYRLASNVDRAAFASLEDQAPLRTGYWSTGSLVVPPPAPASDEPAATTPAGAP